MSSDPKIDIPGEYATSLLNRLGDRDWIDVLASTAGALRSALDGVDDAAVRQPERPGKWSMIEVVQHLADGEMVVGMRVRMIVAEERPPIVAYDQELWADRLRYRNGNASEALAQFAVMREANLRLARQLTPEQLARFGVHSERGAETAGYTLRLLAGHDLVHLDQLARIRRAVTNA
jgi:hypothetical protein